MTNANWKNDPGSGVWNTADNWDPAGVPTGIAAFANSSQTAISFSTSDEANVAAIVFSQGASSYTFGFGTTSNTPALTITGRGIVNESGIAQHFVVASIGVRYTEPQLSFTNSASAGDSNMHYSAGPESLTQGYGGGIIGFHNTATAGYASFTVRTGAGTPPQHGSTVGGEVSFSDDSTAHNASFTIYGSLSLTDGDTFGNVVFHDNAKAHKASFTNIGGTVANGDGGNTQFYDYSTADTGLYHNRGATCGEANGGDVAFDGVAKAGTGKFYNHAATKAGGYGGVTSFNNNENWSDPSLAAAHADHGQFHNYGATGTDKGGGGHTEFTAKYGSPTGGHGTFLNFGSELDKYSTAGHTVLSVAHSSGPADEFTYTDYYPTAGNGVFCNHPGASGGYTEFTVYEDENRHEHPKKDKVTVSNSTCYPTAGDATFYNLGGESLGVLGGYTSFRKISTADNATLIAYAGSGGGGGGQIQFFDTSSGGTAAITIHGTNGGADSGALDLTGHTGELSTGSLSVNGGVIKTSVGNSTTTLALSRDLVLNSRVATFEFKQGDGYAPATTYILLSAPNLGSGFSKDQFTGNFIGLAAPSFKIVGNELQVVFNPTPVD